MDKNSKIYIAGHRGMVGSAIKRKLEEQGYSNFVTRSSSELDLRDQSAVKAFFEQEKPDYVFLAAAKVGGILANDTYRAEFLFDNLMIQTNIIHSSYKTGVKKLMFLGSSCIYPKLASQPMNEDALLTGPLEHTNEPYAIAKIAGIKLCDSYRDQYGCNFVSVMPTNLYGPNDNYHPKNSHVLPGLIRKFHEAKIADQKEVIVWGTGTPKREFLHADDMADACVYLMRTYNSPGIINIGTGKDISINDLAVLIKEIVGFNGKIVFDHSKPDGTPRKLMDVGKLTSLGWEASIPLKEGIQHVYKNLVENNALTNS